jgi:diguanylate cyclase (GGDEF)-like protein
MPPAPASPAPDTASLEALVLRRHVPRTGPVRALAWTLLFLVIAADAVVFTPISLGVLFVVPLALVALFGSSLETVGMALLCWVARLLFGSVGDPLGLSEIAVHLSSAEAQLTQAATALFGYLGIAGVLLRLERQKKALSSLSRAARSDPLTGAANRRRLGEFLSGLAAEGPVSVVAADIDFFKRINDELGHDAGDEVLREVASRLASAVREGELLARTGGEEFLVVLPGADAAVARQIAHRLHRAVIERPVEIGGRPREVTVSLGVATTGGRATEALLKEADTALYAAKRNGRNRIEVSAAA